MGNVQKGSDLPKQEEQLGAGIVNLFPYNFSQNGLVAYKNGEILEIQTISKHLGEDNVKRLVNWVLKYLSELDLPIKVRVAFFFVAATSYWSGRFLFSFWNKMVVAKMEADGCCIFFVYFPARNLY